MHWPHWASGWPPAHASVQSAPQLSTQTHWSKVVQRSDDEGGPLSVQAVAESAPCKTSPQLAQVPPVPVVPPVLVVLVVEVVALVELELVGEPPVPVPPPPCAEPVVVVAPPDPLVGDPRSVSSDPQAIAPNAARTAAAA